MSPCSEKLEISVEFRQQENLNECSIKLVSLNKKSPNGDIITSLFTIGWIWTNCLGLFTIWGIDVFLSEKWNGSLRRICLWSGISNYETACVVDNADDSRLINTVIMRGLEWTAHSETEISAAVYNLGNSKKNTA